jgi:hypothetical protein
MITWVFETSTKNLSTKDVTWNLTNYSGDIITNSFSGITMRWNMGGNGLISPNEMTFEVSNTDDAYNTSDFQDEECIVRLIVDDVQKRVWKFKIERALDYYGKIKCWCVDFLKDKLKGDYPKTKAPKEVWSSGDIDVTDDYTIPVILGTAYIPVRSVNTGTERFYVLGESGPTYTIHEVSSPREWPNRSIWDAASYDMDGYVNSGYQLLQPIIADSNGDSVADAPGLWRSGDMFYDMLCRMERSDTSAYDNPSEWIEYVLKDFGVAAGDIGSTSFAAAATLFDTLTVGFDGGGWWKKEPRERVLSNLLYQVDSYLVLTDQIDLYQFSADSVETISKALLLSFNPSKVTKSLNDSGRVQWPEAYDKPSDVLNGKAVVPTHDSGTENNPSSEILDCRFLSGQSINAQKAGILHFQKKFEQSQRINFAVSFSRLTNQTTLCPGKVVTVDNTLYGGTNKVVITDMTFLPSGRVNFTGVVLNYLEDWGDLTTITKNVVTDTSGGFELATTDYVGNVSSDWDLLLNIPQRFLDTASLGINVTDSYMGYYDGSNFKVFIDSNGNMQCGDPNTGQGFVWNQSTGAFTISGSLTIQNPSGVRSDLNVENGATAGANWNTNLSNIPSFGNMAYEDLVEFAKLGNTVIDGAYLKTSLIDADDIFATNVFTTALSFQNLAGGIKFGSSDIQLYYTNILGLGCINLKAYTNRLLLYTGSSGVKLEAGETGADIELTANDNILLDAGGYAQVHGDERVELDCAAYIFLDAGSYISLDAVTYVDLASGSGQNIELDSGGHVNIDCGGTSYQVQFRSAGTNKAYINAYGLVPNTDNNMLLGSGTQRWSSIYGYSYYDENGLFQDVVDDLEALSQLQPAKKKVTDTQGNITEEIVLDKKTGLPVLDKNKLPRWVTNYDEVVLKLKQDNGEMLTDQDIEEMIQDYDQAGWMLNRNIGHFNDLTNGALRQLDTEVLEMFELLSARITALETRSN